MLLGMAILAAIGSIISTIFELNLLNRALGGEDITIAEAYANDDRQFIVGILSLLAFLIAFISFLSWQFRVSSNLAAFGVQQTHSPCCGIAAWFIPLVNIVMPFLVVREIYKASYSRLRDQEHWTEIPTPSWLFILFPLSLGMIILNGLLGNIPSENDPIESHIYYDYWLIAGDVVLILFSIFLVALVRDIASHQQRRASCLTNLR